MFYENYENVAFSDHNEGVVFQRFMFSHSSASEEENLQMSLPFAASEDTCMQLRNTQIRSGQDLSQEDDQYVQEQIELFSSESSNKTHRIGRRSNWVFFRSNNERG